MVVGVEMRGPGRLITRCSVDISSCHDVAFGRIAVRVIVIDHLHEGTSAQAAFEGVPEGLGALIEQQAMRLAEACEHVLADVRLHIDADGQSLGHRKDAPVHADAKE